MSTSLEHVRTLSPGPLVSAVQKARSARDIPCQALLLLSYFNQRMERESLAKADEPATSYQCDAAVNGCAISCEVVIIVCDIVDYNQSQPT